MSPNYASNLWKMFLYSVSQRRHFYALLSIFFLSLPGTTAQQIGWYTGAGFLLSFILEVPSGYFSDRFGHRRALILSKVSMTLSTVLYVCASNIYFFLFGAILQALGIALDSGTREAFMHETLTRLDREGEFSRIMSRISANVSLVSMFLIILLPLTVVWSIRTPFWINLGIDIVGLFFVISLLDPHEEEKIIQKRKTIRALFVEAWRSGFFPVAIFTGAIVGAMVGTTGFRWVYLDEIGYPVALIGLVGGLSRFFWFVIGHYAHLIQRYLTMRQHFLLEIVFFSGSFALVAFLSNPYVVGLIFAITIGYQWGRGQIINDYFLRDYVTDARYKATFLSIQNQVRAVFQIIIAFLIGIVMNYSYRAGFYTIAVCLLLILTISFLFIRRRD